MLAKGSGAFIRLSGGANAKRVLHSVTIVGYENGRYTAELRDPDGVPNAGQDAILYFDRGADFVQVAVRIDAVVHAAPLATPAPSPAPKAAPGAQPAAKAPAKPGEQSVEAGEAPPCVFGFVTVGEPVSAESRQCYRVSMAVSGLVVQVEGVPCQLVDASATGFAVSCSKEPSVGQTVPVSISFEGKSYVGSATVQGAFALPSGKFRVGMHIVKGGAQGSLSIGLQKITSAVQRAQLRRRAAG